MLYTRNRIFSKMETLSFRWSPTTKVFSRTQVTVSLLKRRFIVFVWTGKYGGFRMSEARDTIESACAQALDVEVSIFESFSRIRVDEQIRFENATCGRRFLLISSLEKKKSLLENIRIPVEGG